MNAQADTRLRLRWRPYRFSLPRQMVTSQGAWGERQGWLLQLETGDGRLGWGEAALMPATADNRGSENQGALAPTADVTRARAPASRSERSEQADPGTDHGDERMGTGQRSAEGPAAHRLRQSAPQQGSTGHPAAAEPRAPAGGPGGAAWPDASHAHQTAHGWPPPIPPGDLPEQLARTELETLLPHLPAPLACALGMALAELDGLGSAAQGGWLAAPASAVLLPAGKAAIVALEQALAEHRTAQARPAGAGIRRSDSVADGGCLQGDGSWSSDRQSAERPWSREAAPLNGADQGPQGRRAATDPPRDWPQAVPGSDAGPLTVKWKVASEDDALERRVLEALLQRLPPQGRLRLDANGGWCRDTAERWADRLAAEPRLEWLEQPLPANDPAGLERLARRLPVALDESLRADPPLLPPGWRGWQVRRPLMEGDPRPLLAALEAGTPRLMLSTALETGIGRRFLAHLAALQALGPTPTAPGLAPGWRPAGALFSSDPQAVWQAPERA